MFKPISRRDLIKKLQRLDFAGPYSGGKHQFMRKGNFKIFIPNPHRKDIGKVLLSRITKEIGISMNDFLNLY